MVHWYQWCDWYQWKMMPFQWFYFTPSKSALYSSFYQPTMQNKFAFTPSKNALIIIMNIPRSISQPRKTSSLLHQLKTRHNSYEYSSQNKFAFTQSRNALIVTKRGRPIYLALIISQGAASITNIVRTLKLKGNASLSCSFCLL